MVLSIRVGKISSVTSLRYLSETELRQQISEMDDKVEAYHGFAGWLLLGGEGVIAANDSEEQKKLIKYNDLIANAVIFQNVVDVPHSMSRITS